MPDVPPSPPDQARAAHGAWTVALGDAPGRDADSGASDALAPGAVVGDHEILGVLGRGGFGITYRALDRRSGRQVALKEFFPAGCVRRAEAASTWRIEPTPSLGASAFEIARAQFLEAARALGRLRHPSLARVWSSFERHNSAYLVMELLQGRTLQECVQQSGPLDEQGAVAVAHALGEAASTLHRLEFLHLDIKPANVMLCPAAGAEDAGSPASTWGGISGSRVVLFDFDLLQRIEDSSLSTRPLTSHCGTPGYAPLEQYAQHAALGPFTDVYALGATLLYLLTAHDPPAAADRALSDAPFRARDWRPGLGEPLASALEWALEIAPAARPQSVEAWLPSLQQGRPQPAVPARTAAPAQAGGTRGTMIIGSSILPGAAIVGAQPLPVAASPASLPPLPMSDNWYQFAARQADFEWPDLCACCGQSPDTTLPVRAGHLRWHIPYCARCARHVSAGHQASAGTSWGIAAGLAVAFVGWLLSDIWIGPLGVSIHFSSLAYGALKVQASEALMGAQCCDRKHAVGYGGERETRSGRKYLVRFRSLEYAHAWKDLNASKL